MKKTYAIIPIDKIDKIDRKAKSSFEEENTTIDRIYKTMY